jgi:2-amino-4-hydroxy-6-hydroxymethyldihydropteridine diphosphokinase
MRAARHAFYATALPLDDIRAEDAKAKNILVFTSRQGLHGMETQSVIAFIGLGSNLGDREVNLREALKRLTDIPGTRVLRQSSFIETEPVDAPPGSGQFLNGVAMVQTFLDPRRLLDELLQIERDLGRDRQGQPRNAPRTLDLDLLLYGDQVINEPDLQVPHPRMHEREFVLWPLLQIASKVKDPRTGEPFASAYDALKGH